MRSGGKRPRTAAKETPPDLPRHLENIQEILGYVVSSRVLDAQDYQVAQIVAIRRDSRRQRFEWPKPLGKRSLSAVLDPPVRTDKPGRLPKSERPKKLARMAMSKIWAQGVDPCKVPCAIDVGCSERYLTWKVGVAPTLCRARGGSGGFWLSSRGRKTTLRELMRITSINPEELQGWEACCTGPQLGSDVRQLSACAFDPSCLAKRLVGFWPPDTESKQCYLNAFSPCWLHRPCGFFWVTFSNKRESRNSKDHLG